MGVGDTIGRSTVSLLGWGSGTLSIGLLHHCWGGVGVGDTIGRSTVSLLGWGSGTLSIGLLCHCWGGGGGRGHYR